MAISFCSLWSCDSACFTCSLAARIQWITGREGKKRRQEKGNSLGIFLLCLLLPQICSFGTKRTENIICIPAVNTDWSLWLCKTTVPTPTVPSDREAEGPHCIISGNPGFSDNDSVVFYNCLKAFTLLCYISHTSFQVCSLLSDSQPKLSSSCS